MSEYIRAKQEFNGTRFIQFPIFDSNKHYQREIKWQAKTYRKVK